MAWRLNAPILGAYKKEDTTKFLSAYADAQRALNGVRTILNAQASAGMTPAVTSSNADVRDLIVKLIALNTALKPFNNGQDTIPITGSNDDQKFQSLNKWLGRKPSEPFTPDALKILERKLAEAGTKATSPGGSGSGGTAPVPVPVPAKPAEKSAPSPVVVVTPAPATKPAETKPPASEVKAPETKAPAKSPQELLRDEHKDRLDALERIIENHPQRLRRNQANQHKRDLERQIGKGKVNERTVKNIDTFIERYSKEAARKELETAGQTEGKVDPAKVATDDSPAGKLQRDLLKMQEDLFKSTSASKNRIINNLPNVWLLGATQRNQMAEHLLKAGKAALEGNESEAKSETDKAEALFKAEQELYAKMLETIVIPSAEASANAIGASELPTKKEMEDAEKAENKKRKTKKQKSISWVYRSKQRLSDGSRVYNTREGLEAAMRDRAKNGRNYITSNRGKLSFNFVSDLFESVSATDKTASTLAAFWKYAKDNGLSSLPPEKAELIWARLSDATATLIDPNYDPYMTYPEPLKNTLLHQFRQSSGNPNLTYQDVVASIKVNMPYRYDDALWGVFDQTVELSPPVPAALQPAVSAISKCRAARTLFEMEYTDYLVKAKSNDTERLEDAKSFVNHAISLLPSNERWKPFVDNAKWWLRHFEKVPDAQKAKVADSLYEMAMNLVALYEADVWVSTPGLHGNASQDDIKRAKRAVWIARQLYTFNFNNPSLEITLYPRLPRSTSDVAINLVAPQAFAVNEVHEVFSISHYGLNSREHSMELVDPGEEPPADATKEEKRDYKIAKDAYDQKLAELGVTPLGEKPTEEDKIKYQEQLRKVLRDAETKDRELMWKAGAEAVEANMRMVISMRQDQSYGRTSTDTVSGQAGWLSPMATLSPRVSREALIGRTPQVMANSTPLRSSRRRLTVDILDMGEARIDNSTYPHELADVYPQGGLYAEIYRQMILKNHEGISPLLRQLTLGTYVTGMESAATGYTSLNPAAQRTAANAVLLQIDQKRVQDLEARLSGKIAIVDQKGKTHTFVISQLADKSVTEDPKSYYVKRAQGMLNIAKALLGELSIANGQGQDINSRRVGVRLAIEIAEAAIDSIDDDLKKERWNIKAPPVSQGSFEFANPSNSVVLSRSEASSRSRTRGILTSPVMVRPGPNQKPVPLEQYEKQHGPQNVVFSWFVYQNIGVRDPVTKEYIYLLLDPANLLNPVQKATGRVMKNVPLPWGGRGDAVVRVRPLAGALGARDMPWEVVKDLQGNPEVLYALAPGTLQPMLTPQNLELLNKNLSRYATFSSRRRSYIEMFRRDTLEAVVIPIGTPTVRQQGAGK